MLCKRKSEPLHEAKVKEENFQYCGVSNNAEMTNTKYIV